MDMELKSWLEQKVFTKSGTFNNRCSTVQWWNKYPDQYNAVLLATAFLPPDANLKYRLECILQDITEKPVCKTCGSDVKLHKNKFSTYCSLKCAAVNKETKNKRKNTTKQKYGVEYISQSPEIREKIENSYKRIPDSISKYLNDKEWLYEQHVTNKKTLVEIVDILFNLTNEKIYYGTVQDYLDRHSIDFQINKTGTSMGEVEVCQFLDTLGIKYIKNYRISNKELDIFIPSHNIGIEYNGLYWHSYGRLETPAEKDKHRNKTDFFLQHGIETFHIFEHEWQDEIKRNIWKSMLRSRLNISPYKQYARKLKLVDVLEKKAREFFNLTHLYGHVTASSYIGLENDNGELLCLMSFKKSRFNNKYDFEIVRFSSKLDYQIIGGFSKILKKFERDNNSPSIISYCNKRYSIGNVYTKNGFTSIGETSPNYFYWDRKNVYSRHKFQKHKLKNILDNYDDVLSESQNMFNNGYRRFWDCGNLVFIKN